MFYVVIGIYALWLCQRYLTYMWPVSNCASLNIIQPGPTMRLQKRQNEILASVKLHGACSIIELARQLEVSDETIRRNIKTKPRE